MTSAREGGAAQRVLVIGAGGQLGEAFASTLESPFEVVGRSRAELDVTDPDAVRATVDSVRPRIVMNCAAYTNVDGAEREPSSALAVNALAVRGLAAVAAQRDAIFVHYSTDFVFDGKTSTPYTEDDEPNPRGAYAVSKLLGEWFAAGAPRHYILRVESLFGGRRAKSSIDRILDGIVEGREVRAFHDRVVSPSYVHDVVTATRALLLSDAASGVYHCVNSGHTTWSALAREAARLANKPDAAIRDVSLDDAGLVPPRPKFSALSNARLAGVGIVMPSWQDALRRYVPERLER